MHINQEKYEKFLPLFFKYFNHGMVMLWKLGLGKLINCWPSVIGRIMVISHHGRGSGRPYLTPVNYCTQGEYVYCTSAFGGGSDWFLNVLSNPQIEIWLPGGWFSGKAEIVDEPLERAELLRKVLIESGFAAHFFVGIDPKTIGEEQFNKVTSTYKLLRITRQSACTGADGPGSLAWLWPLITIMLLFRRRRKRK